MAELRRYGVASTIVFPLIKRAVVDFAVSGDYTPVNSDSRVHLDTASASYTIDTLVATGSHFWAITLKASEMQAKQVQLVVVDAATKAVEDQAIIIETYGSSLAMHPFDLSINTVTVATVSAGAIAAVLGDIANSVWATGSRTLTSFGTLQGDIVNNVWATPSRTLTQGAYDQLVNQIWATASRTLSSFGTLQGDIVNNVWATPSRTLSSFGTLQGDIVNNVWATPSRTLTSLGTGVIGDETFKNSGIFVITSNVWATASRTLTSFGTLQTDIVNNVWATPSRTLTQGAYDQMVNQTWATPSRTLTSLGTDIISAAAVSAAGANKISDHVWRRTYANIHASANGDTLTDRSGLGAQAKLVNKVTVSGSTLQSMHEDDSTIFLSQTIATDASAAPIISLDTV